jgi:hypothetical protein
MNEAAKTQAQAIFKRREAERAEFDAQLKAQRDKAQRLRALRLAREEARWVEHRSKVIEGIKRRSRNAARKDSRDADKAPLREVESNSADQLVCRWLTLNEAKHGCPTAASKPPPLLFQS